MFIQQDTAVVTVCSPSASLQPGIVDAHNHLWISPVGNASVADPEVDEFDSIQASLSAFRGAGGAAVLDSQPGQGCGRDGQQLHQLSRSTDIHIFACTGFHRERYYPEGFWLFKSEPEQAQEHFLNELNLCLSECEGQKIRVRAGYIKIAAGATLADTPLSLMEAAAGAATQTGSILAVHTEHGKAADQLFNKLINFKVPANRIMLCHMDKNPDIGLHRELAQSGVLLEYDTFFRPKYHPEELAWPLLFSMVEYGHEQSVAIGTDMAYNTEWKASKGSPTLSGMHTHIASRLKQAGYPDSIVQDLQGDNILGRLHRPILNPQRSSTHV